MYYKNAIEKATFLLSHPLSCNDPLKTCKWVYCCSGIRPYVLSLLQIFVFLSTKPVLFSPSLVSSRWQVFHFGLHRVLKPLLGLQWTQLPLHVAWLRSLNISLTQYFYCVSYFVVLVVFFSYFIPLCHLTVPYIEIETVFLRINNKYFLKFKINQTFHLFYSWLYFVHFISSVL